MLNLRLLIVSIMSFCLALSAGFVIPLYPLFIKSLGASFILIGVVQSSRAFPNVFLRAPTGALSDRIGRKPLIIMGAILYTIIPLIYTQIKTATYLIPFVILQGIGMACLWPSSFAYVADITDPNSRGKFIGGFSTIFGSAYTIGTAIGGYLTEHTSYINTYRTASFIAFIGLLVAIFGVKEARSSSDSAEKSKENQSGFIENLKIISRSPSLLLAAASMLASSTILTTTTTFFPLYGDQIGLGETLIGFALFILSVVSTALRLPGGALADKIEKKLALTLAIVLCLIPITTISLTTNFLSILLLLIILGVGEGMAQAIPIVLITSEKGLPKGFSVGMAMMFGFFGKFVAPTLFGLLSEAGTLAWAFWAGALISGPPYFAALLISRRMERYYKVC